MTSASRIAGSGAQWMAGSATKAVTPSGGGGSSVSPTGTGSIVPSNANVAASFGYGSSMLIMGVCVTGATAGTITVYRADTSSATSTDDATLVELISMDVDGIGYVSFGPEGILMPRYQTAYGFSTVCMFLDTASMAATLIFKLMT
jgi:hypothetical protein